MSYKCPFCSFHEFYTIEDYKECIKSCGKNKNIARDRCIECDGCKKLILSKLYQPTSIKYMIYLNCNVCGKCKETKFDSTSYSDFESHLDNCNIYNGPKAENLCMDCIYKDISGILTRLGYIKKYAKQLWRSNQLRLCFNCFTPIQRINGCELITCNCGEQMNYFETKYHRANINDEQLGKLIGVQLEAETPFNTMYFSQGFNIPSFNRQQNSNPACGSNLKQSSTKIVNNTKVQEKPKECPICIEQKECYLIQPCKHWCCKECIIKTNKQECPFCRSNFVAYFLNTNK